MKKNFKFILVIMGCFILNHQTVCAESSMDSIVAAINDLNKSTTTSLVGTNSDNTNLLTKLKEFKDQMVSVLNNIFVGVFDSSGTLTAPSVLDNKLTFYSQKFYSLYTTTTFDSLDFSTKNQATEDAVKYRLSQDLGYNIQRTLPQKTNDLKLLAIQPFDSDSNNSSVTPSQYGSLDPLAPTASTIPNVSDLIGKDAYNSEAEQNKAMLFISYLLKSTSPPKNFYIPDKSLAKDNSVSVYLPVASGDSPYTSVSIATNSDDSGTSEYDRMVKYLNNEYKYYQPYKLKTRSAYVSRTLYLESMLRLYQERIKDLKNKDDQSLVEKEKEAAVAVLDKKYYEDLKTKSVADVNLEMLRAINRLNYFLYKIHQDNERNNMVSAASSLQLSGADPQDEKAYIEPISTLINNRCWDLDNASDDRKKACSQPQTAAYQPST